VPFTGEVLTLDFLYLVKMVPIAGAGVLKDLHESLEPVNVPVLS
jgi:hypothetical protein